MQSDQPFKAADSTYRNDKTILLKPAGAKAAKAAPSPQTPVFSEQWDASLDTLTAVQQQLTAQDSTAGDRFSLRLNDLKQALLVPQHRQVLHRHAIRLLLQQAADSIDTVADAVKQVINKAFHDSSYCKGISESHDAIYSTAPMMVSKHLLLA